MNKIKEFFRSGGFKAVAVLLVICIVCVGLLAVLNDVLYVSDDVRFQRAMNKIYKVEGASFTKVNSLDSNFITHSAYGSVKSVTEANKDGQRIAVVIEAEGPGGWGGSVVCYVVIGEDATIKAWTVKSFNNETLTSGFGKKQYNSWYIGKNIVGEIEFNSQVKSTGATMTSSAINNAINMACYYTRNALGIGENPEADAKAEVLELLASTPYSAVTLNSKSKSSLTHLSFGGKLSYVFEATSGSDKICAYAYKMGADDTLDYIVINVSYNDAVRAQEIAKTANISAEIETAVKQTYFNSNACITTIAISGSVYTYNVIGNGIDHAPNITLTITVSNGVVTDLAFIGAITNDWDTAPNKGDFIGATIDTIGSKNSTGASESSSVIRNAVTAALQHYAANNA